MSSFDATSVNPPLDSVARPKQARSERTMLRILDAAEDLIAAKGLRDVSIPDIVAHAHSSVGGFYARFKDKNELLRALEERFFLRVTDQLEALADPSDPSDPSNPSNPSNWQGDRLADMAKRLVHELVQTVEENRRLIEAFLIRSSSDPGFRDEGLRFRSRVSSRITPVLLTRREEIRHPEPDVAIDLGIQVAFAMMLQHVSLGGTRAGSRELSQHSLQRELVRGFLGYLGVPYSEMPDD